MNLIQIIGQHSKSVAQSFKEFGIDAPVTEKDLMLQMCIYKQPLIDSIEKNIGGGSFANYTGTVTDGNDVKNGLMLLLNSILGINSTPEQTAEVKQQNSDRLAHVLMVVGLLVVVVLSIIVFTHKK